MDDFSDYLCTVCGQAIGPEPYFASFSGRSTRTEAEPIWPESVFHRRCMTDYADTVRGERS